jgi:hypothetical protein
MGCAACSSDGGLLVDAAATAADAATPADAPAPAPDAAVPQVVELGGWTVTAETPALSTDGTMVTGSVTFARQSGSDTRGGGACLVADLNNSFPCSTAEDCASLPLPAGGYHYCVPVNGAGPSSCWTRPSGDPCTRSPSRTPGTYATSETDARVDGAATTWMTLACLAADGAPMGCASGDPTMYVYATGLTLSVPAP